MNTICVFQNEDHPKNIQKHGSIYHESLPFKASTITTDFQVFKSMKFNE